MAVKISNNKDTISISNPYLELTFDKTANGALVAITDKMTGHRFLHNGNAEKTLFRLAVRTLNDGKVHWIDSRQASEFTWHKDESIDNAVLRLTLSSFLQMNLEVCISITVESNSPLSRWNIVIFNREEVSVFNIACPVIGGLFEPGNPVEKEAVITGRQGEGYIFENPYPVVDSLPLKMGTSPDSPSVGMGKLHGMYPGSQQMQFILYNCHRAGLYLATHDDRMNFKSFDLGSMPDWETYPMFSYSNPKFFEEKDGIIEAPMLSVSHFPGDMVKYDISIEYDTMLGVFHGDWYDGADIYKEWARKQWWCREKLWDKKIPGWLRNGFGVFLFSNHNGLHIDRIDHSLDQIADFIDNLSKEMGVPVLAPVFNWEGKGAWTSPAGLFPPREGLDRFKAAAGKLKETGSLVSVSIPGDEWYVHIPFMPHSLDFDCWDEFNAKARHCAVVHSDGELYIRKLAPGWEQIQLCPYTGELENFMIDLYKKCLEIGVSVVWNGGFPDGGDYSCCYNPDHGHPPGYGSWWPEVYCSILDKLNRECRNVNPDFVHAGEGICEIFIPYLDLYDHRAGMFEVFSHCEEDFPVGGRLIPLFNYVYSEYIGAFSAPWPECNRPEVLYWARCMGKSLAQGVVPMGSWFYPEPDTLNLEIFEFYKKLTRAVVKECWKYIMFGEMLKPPKIDVPFIEFSYLKGAVDGMRMDGKNRHIVRDAAVEYSVWRAQDGDTGYIFINVSRDTIDFEVELSACEPDNSLYDIHMTTDGKRAVLVSKIYLSVTRKIILKPLSVVVIEVVKACDR